MWDLSGCATTWHEADQPITVQYFPSCLMWISYLGQDEKIASGLDSVSHVQRLQANEICPSMRDFEVFEEPEIGVVFRKVLPHPATVRRQTCCWRCQGAAVPEAPQLCRCNAHLSCLSLRQRLPAVHALTHPPGTTSGLDDQSGTRTFPACNNEHFLFNIKSSSSMLSSMLSHQGLNPL